MARHQLCFIPNWTREQCVYLIQLFTRQQAIFNFNCKSPLWASVNLWGRLQHLRSDSITKTHSSWIWCSFQDTVVLKKLQAALHHGKTHRPQSSWLNPETPVQTTNFWDQKLMARHQLCFIPNWTREQCVYLIQLFTRQQAIFNFNCKSPLWASVNLWGRLQHLRSDSITKTHSSWIWCSFQDTVVLKKLQAALHHGKTHRPQSSWLKSRMNIC